MVSKHLVDNYLRKTVMNVKLSILSDLANILSVKSSVGTSLLTLFNHFGLGHLLCRMSLEKEQGVSAVQLILSLCLFRIGSESIHSVYKKGFHDLLDTGKNCYYRMMTRAAMDWRKLLLGMASRFQGILRKEHANDTSLPKCYILDDTTTEKSGLAMEHISRVFDHVKGKCVLGFKVLVCAFFDGKSTLPIDFSIHSEKGKNGDYGLTAKQRRKRFSKKREATCPDFQRAKEATRSKLDVAVEMLKRAWSYPALRAQYVLCDSWFTCERLLKEVRKIGNGAMHLVGLAKMGNTRYAVCGKLHNAIELIALYERERIHGCRKYKCQYISLQGRLGEQPVRIFLIRYGHNQRWNILLTSDLSMTFVKAFEIYQIRWNIEVLNKEAKQYLGLGGYQGRDFDGQIADCTICFITYLVMALEKRFSEYETMGQLFVNMESDVRALTLWSRMLDCIRRLLEVLCGHLGITLDELAESILNDEDAAEAYFIMAKALESRQSA